LRLSLDPEGTLQETHGLGRVLTPTATAPGTFDPASAVAGNVITQTHSFATGDSLVYDLPADNARDYAADAFLRGELSLATIPHGRLPEFKARRGTQIITRQELSTTFIGLNQGKPPFDDRRVRQAFALAFDRETILQRDRDTRIPTNGILPPGMPGYTPDSKLLQHDPDRARALLAEAGYPGGHGLPPIVFTTGNQTEDSRQLLEQIRSQMQAVGIQIETESLSWLEFSDRLLEFEIERGCHCSP